MVRHIVVFLIGVLILSIQSNRVTCEDLVVTTDDITLYFYTQSTIDDPEILGTSDLSDLSSSKFNSELPNYFVFHGILSNYTHSLYIKDPLLSVADVNLFLVDYSRPASNRSWYEEAIEGTSSIVANYIKLIESQYGVASNNFTLVGFSLGCHVAGETGNALDADVGTIIALDPPGDIPSHIDSTKGAFVHVVHTGSNSIRGQVGHADFYVNDIDNGQPGCEGDSLCGHYRSTLFYAESLSSGGFTAVQCNNYTAFSEGLCADNDKSYLGGLNLNRSSSGIYYLATNSQSPFSLG